MKLILSDKKLNENEFPKDVSVKYVSYKSMDAYDGNTDILAIAGSRAMALKAEKMKLPGLKFIQLTSAGFDGVPIEKYAERGIPVANAGAVYSIPIAETVVFGMLLVSKKLRNNPNNRHFKIQRHYNTITELAGKRVLIMGAGNIGTAVAKRLIGFDVTIDGYDPYCPEKPEYEHIIRDRDNLIADIDKYDYVISTLPDNKQTKNFINKDILYKMKKSSIIVNVGRKAVFDEIDLYNALKQRIIGGAVLDMFERLPNPIQNRFRRLNNVVVLPGVAAISQEVNLRLQDLMTKNLLSMVNGTAIDNIINGVEL